MGKSIILNSGKEVKIFVTANGIASSHFIGDEPRDYKRCIYASSPDRGLDTLLQLWPDIYKKVPDAELHVFYGFTANFDALHKNNQHMMEFKDWCLKALKQPGVIYHGRVSHAQLAKEFMQAALWTYPTQFTEISCCVGDTPILMPRDHQKYPYGVPIRELVGKSGFFVYSYDHEKHRIELGKVLWVKKTREQAELLRIALDDGTILRFTPDHLFLMRDGTYKSACDLRPGDSVLPCYERPTFMVKQPDGEWTYEHRMAAESRHGSIPSGFHVDHVDGNRYNNDIDNLQVLSPSEHAKKIFGTQRTFTAISFKRMSDSQKKLARTPERQAFLRKHGIERARKFWDDFKTRPEDKQKEWIRARREKTTLSGAVVASPEQKREWGSLGGMKRWHNHKVMSISKDIIREDVYDMEVEKYHNFAAGGVFVHNCITAMKAQAAGAIPVTAALAALNETVTRGYKLSFSFADRRTQQSFVNIVVDLLQHPDKQEKLRNGMREWARQQFDWQRVAELWDQHLKSCLTQRETSKLTSSPTDALSTSVAP